jgi:hypothetical protein
MFRILIDTCVWLDLAKDHRQVVLLEVLESLVKGREIELILPRTIVEEFARNKARVADESGRSLSAALKRAKDIVGRLGAGRGKRLAIAHLDEVDYRLPTLGEAAIESIGRIERLFSQSAVLDVSEPIVLRAARRAIERRAPFQRQRNSMDDAILLEMYIAQTSQRGRGTRYAFITHNTKDFSQPHGDTRQPHPDLAPHFSRIRSLYLTSLGEALRRVAPTRVDDATIEQEWTFEPRRHSEILAAVDEFTDKVWYGRHGLLRHGVETGKIKVVTKETFPRDPNNRTVQRDIWGGARRAARKVEHRYGLDNLGPWDNFEWGMLSGKLSALRWVLGDEWDMLDT